MFAARKINSATYFQYYFDRLFCKNENEKKDFNIPSTPNVLLILS